MTFLALAAFDVCVADALAVDVPEDVAVAVATAVDTGVTAASVAFVQLTLSGMVALSESVRSAHYGISIMVSTYSLRPM